MKPKRLLSYERKKSLSGYLFLLPWMIGFFGIFLRSFISSIIYSFNNLQITTEGVKLTFNNFANFEKAFLSDANFLPMLTSQLQEMLINVPVILIFSLFIAVLLNQNFRGRAFARSVFFLPVIIGSGIIISIIQGDSMSNDILSGTRASGLFDSGSFFDILLESGLDSDLVNQMISIVSNIFDLAWRAGLQIILFLAALQTVPEQLYEVAKVEGATSWEVFFKITLPMITPILLINIIYTVIDNFTDYGNELLLYIVNIGKRLDFAYSAALGNVYFVVIFVVVAVLMIVVGKKVTYVEK